MLEQLTKLLQEQINRGEHIEQKVTLAYHYSRQKYV